VTRLQAHVVVARPSFGVDLELDVAEGQVLAVLGPNGAGKSTALAALAGGEPLEQGFVRLGSATLSDVQRRIDVDISRRSIGWVFQDSLLFPHLTVLENVAFGLRARGMPRRAALAAAEEWLRLLRIERIGGSRPREISGGEAQRAALARALAPSPQLLLLDEPLAALDAEVRDEVRADLAVRLSAHRGCTVLVTHDPADAVALADDIVILERGRVVQRGTPEALRASPASSYVAAMFPG
jgi:molybdate transport system ATP-binding protein